MGIPEDYEFDELEKERVIILDEDEREYLEKKLENYRSRLAGLKEDCADEEPDIDEITDPDSFFTPGAGFRWTGAQYTIMILERLLRDGKVDVNQVAEEIKN